MTEVFVRDESRKVRTLCNRYSGMMNLIHDERVDDPDYKREHLMWMLDRIRYDETQSLTSKHRWLGWIQCVLTGVHKVTSVQAERDFTRNILQGS